MSSMLTSINIERIIRPTSINKLIFPIYNHDKENPSYLEKVYQFFFEQSNSK